MSYKLKIATEIILVRQIESFFILSVAFLIKLMETIEKGNHCLVKFLMEVILQPTGSIPKINQWKINYFELS